MTDSKALARPPQVTMAAWVTMVGSVFVVLYAFEVVANLGTIQTREQVEEVLSSPPGSWLDLGVQEYLDLVRVAAMVAAACAAAAGILGWQVLTRSRSARVALSVLAVPLLVSGSLTDGFVSSLVAFSAVFLWLKPARDWFNGVAPTPPQVAEPVTPTHPGSPDHADHSQHSGQPGPTGVFPHQPPPSPTPYGVRPAFSNARPVEVVQACVITWLLSGLVLIGSVPSMLVFIAGGDLMQEVYDSDPQLAESGVDLETLRWFMVAALAIVAVWSGVAIVLAVLAFLGRNWARIGLVVSAATTAVLCLVMSAVSIGMLVPVAASGVVVVLLLRPRVKGWYTRSW